MKTIILTTITLALLVACNPHDAAVQFNNKTNQKITNIIKPITSKVTDFQVNVGAYCQIVTISTLDNFHASWDSADEGCDRNDEFTMFQHREKKRTPYTFNVKCEDGACKGSLYASKRDFKDLNPDTILLHSKYRFNSTYRLLQEKRAKTSAKTIVEDANTDRWYQVLTKESTAQVIAK